MSPRLAKLLAEWTKNVDGALEAGRYEEARDAIIGLLAERRGDLVSARKVYQAVLDTRKLDYQETFWARSRLGQMRKP